MPRASRRNLSPAKQKELTNLYQSLISRLKKSDYIYSFFDEFYTPEEKVMLAKRLTLFILLRKGYNSTEIKNAIGLSPETIRIYRRELVTKSTKFMQIIDALVKSEKNKEFMKEIERKLRPLDDMLNAKTSIKSRARLISNDYK